ncbi:hypothetical protein AB0K16_53130 [Nonomuraea jabiensis]|uniref:hypothetical protein n=1 Tax=Nonomuraea jabiensis TaxID=882448 RepID=UPI003434016E
MRLVWRKPFKAEERARVVAWTCQCRTIVYELCRAAGQSYIRRTAFGKDGQTVHETYRWSFAEANKVWDALLEGQAV